MGKQHEYEDMLGICRPLLGSRPAAGERSVFGCKGVVLFRKEKKRCFSERRFHESWRGNFRERVFV